MQSAANLYSLRDTQLRQGIHPSSGLQTLLCYHRYRKSYDALPSFKQPVYVQWFGYHVYRGCPALAVMGPEPNTESRSRRTRKPEWVRILEDDVDNDPAVAKLLEGTDGDPERIREKMKFALKEQDMQRVGQGAVVPPTISFRAISPMGLWVWLEFLEEPVSGERELLEGVLKSWFAVGKLGGYNSQNMQVFQNADLDQSFFEYDNDELAGGEARMSSYVHDIGEVEYNEKWARVWIDMGTADELSLDVLLNMLVGFSTEMCGLKSIRLGGENEDWPLPEDDLNSEKGLMGADGDYMKVGMNPMKLPEGLDEEFQFMEDEGMFEAAKGRPRGRPSSGGSGSASGSSGYSVAGDPFGANAEERELQDLAAKLRRRTPAGAASSAAAGGGASPRRGPSGGGGGGIYGAGLAEFEGADPDPDGLEFIDLDSDDLGAQVAPRQGSARGGSQASPSSGGAGGTGAGAGTGQQQQQQQQQPWGASFVRRVGRDSRGLPKTK